MTIRSNSYTRWAEQLTACYSRGIRDFKDGLNPSDCPYTGEGLNLQRMQQWMSGFTTAEKAITTSRTKPDITVNCSATTPCDACNGTMVDPAGTWEVIEGHKIDFCRKCNGSGRDLTKPPCIECRAETREQAATMCLCSSDRDSCHGCDIWSDS